MMGCRVAKAQVPQWAKESIERSPAIMQFVLLESSRIGFQAQRGRRVYNFTDLYIMTNPASKRWPITKGIEFTLAATETAFISRSRLKERIYGSKISRSNR